MKSKNLLLSIIIPIYKVEEYLPKCIESILHQTYTNMEILLIDDGSPDRCGLICDDYAGKDKRIRVYHKENGGNGDALNYGFRYSIGDYIAFVDGDDYIENKDAFLLLMKEAKESEADIVAGNYHKEIEGQLVPTNPHGFDKYSDSKSADFRFKGFYSIGHLAYTWGKVYKRSFLLKNNLKLKPYIYALDKLFNVECYIHNPKYSFIPDSVYVYRYNNSSISHRYKKNYSDIWLKISEEIYTDIVKTNVNMSYMDIVVFNLFFAVFFSSKQEYQYFGKNREAVKTEFKKYMKDKLMRQFTKEVVKGKYLCFKSSFLWMILIWGLSVGLYFKLYGLMSMGIKLLVDLNIDGILSSSGKVKIQ